MAIEICNEIRKDMSDSCTDLYDKEEKKIKELKKAGLKRCKELCRCSLRPWHWGCCILQGICKSTVWIIYISSIAAIFAIYTACLATSIIVTVVCYTITIPAAIVLEAGEFFLTGLLILFKVSLGHWCKDAEILSAKFEYSGISVEDHKTAISVEDHKTGIPQDSDKEIFAYRSESPSGLRIQYLGTNSIHISDGETNLLIDPYFTRPNIEDASLLFCNSKKIEPNKEIIAKVLEGSGINKVDAILTTHAHYDHALDLAEVSKCISGKNDNKYPKIFGSKSIYHICKGGGVPNDDITVLDENHLEYIPFGSFEKITFLKGKHLPIPVVGHFLSGNITHDIIPPANIFNYKEGGTYSIYIEHKWGNILCIGSANCLEGAFDNINNIDTLIIGIAGFDVGLIMVFDRFNLKYKDEFYKEVVEATNPKQIFFSHWDDFNKQLDEKYPKWFKEPIKSREFFIGKDSNLQPKFLPIGGFIELGNI